MEDLVTIRTFLNPNEAEIAKSVLESEDIVSHIQANDCGSMRPDLSFLVGGIKLIVRKEDAQKAENCLKEFEEADGE